MSGIYLTRVRISNFRTYGPGFQLDLPPGPGILVLNGMNGLGKTAFFEAIEWALTGTVQRLRTRLRPNMQLDRRLTREAADVASGTHEVELTFNEGTVLRRNATESPSSASLVELLRQPDWKPAIHDVGTYLRLTHFLPQSSRERYLEHDEDEQWQLLKGPAGVERLEKFRALLNDRKALAAFTARIEHLELVRENSKRAFEDWTLRLQQREALRAGVLASGACSPERAIEVVEQIRQQIATLEDAPAPADPGGSEAAQRLVALRRTLDSRRTHVVEALQRIPTAEKTVTDWEALVSRRGAVLERQRVIEASLPVKLAAAETAIASFNEKRDQLTLTESMAQEASRRAENLRLILNALRALSEEITPALQSARENLATISGRENELSERMRLHVESRATRENIERQIRETRQTQASLAPSAARLVAALETRTAAERAVASREAALEEARIASEKEADAVRNVATTTENVAQLQARFDAEQAAADIISKAVAEIAGHLHEEDTCCPVCEHLYAPGELRARARAAVRRLAPGFGDLTEKLDTARQAVATANGALLEARRLSGFAAEKLGAITRAQEEAATRKSALENDPVFPLIEIGALTTWLEARQNELSELADRLSVELAAPPSSSELDRESQSLRDAGERLARERAQSATTLHSLESQRDDYEAILGAHLPLIAPLDRHDVAGLAVARDQAMRQIAEHTLLAGTLKAELQPLEAAVRTNQESYRASQNDQKNALDELQTIERLATGLIADWRRCGLAGEPDRETLSKHRSDWLELQSQYDGMLERQRVIAEELLAWQQHEQLRRLEGDLRSAVERDGEADEASHQDRLEKSIQEADAALSRAQAAAQQAAEISQELQVSAETFSTTALAPLSNQISAFSRLVSPFGYQFHVRARHAATQVRAELAISDHNRATGNRAPREHDPAMWLSEGQASALGLCVLLGASTAYRWARWPALLLDDPLQNTDLIHAAAFVNIIRGLMKDSSYQIFVSTHDGQEADFLIRRCTQLGLPVTRMDFLGLTPEGVRYKTKVE